jgi:hypothetical protein
MLREARIRARIDISEIEAKTKIRAKYLRALENEEWDLLPGPTYVKSFLRTYAEALGLDAKLLVEEYKLRHERLSDVEMQPIMAGSPQRERRRPGAGIPRWSVAAAGVAAVVVILLVVGSSSNTGKHHARPTPAAGRGRHGATGASGLTTARPVRVSLQLLPTAPVYVCLQAYGGHRVLNGATLTPGTRQAVYHSRRFKMTFGNGSLRMRINGRLLTVPQVSTAINYVVTARGRRLLPVAQAPTCR